MEVLRRAMRKSPNLFREQSNKKSRHTSKFKIMVLCCCPTIGNIYTCKFMNGIFGLGDKTQICPYC